MKTGTDLILVTGATGQQGGAVARELLAKGHKVRAMTRKPESSAAKELKALGAEIVTGDLDDAVSLERALAGVWGVYAVQNTWEAGVEREEEQGKRIAEVAKRAGVQHFVYASVGSAHKETGIPHFENKSRVEGIVRALGFPSYVILRPVFFMENLSSPMFLPAIEQGHLAVAMDPNTPLQMIAVRDIGRYGAWALEHPETLNGRAIDIAGDKKTMPETAAILGRVLNRTVSHLRVPIEEVRKFSDDFATMLEWFDEVGYSADIASTSKESGIQPTTLEEWAKSAFAPAGAAR